MSLYWMSAVASCCFQTSAVRGGQGDEGRADQEPAGGDAQPGGPRRKAPEGEEGTVRRITLRPLLS